MTYWQARSVKVVVKTGPGCFDTGNGISSNYKQDDVGKGEVLVLFVAKVWM